MCEYTAGPGAISAFGLMNSFDGFDCYGRDAP
jgi:hypothetical protein